MIRSIGAFLVAVLVAYLIAIAFLIALPVVLLIGRGRPVGFVFYRLGRAALVDAQVEGAA